MEIVDYRKNDNGLVTFQMILREEDWTPFLEAASLQLQKTSPVPGFRAGKAPLAEAAAFYGEELLNAARTPAAQRAMERFVSEKHLLPVTVPESAVMTQTLDRLHLAVRFINYPEVAPFLYKGIKAERPCHKVTQAEVDAAVEKYLDTHLQVRPVSRSAARGDIAEIAYHADADGRPFPLCRSNAYRLPLGSGQLFAGLDEALYGHSAGDTLSLTLTMPSDFHREDLAGKTIRAEVTLLSVSERTRPACTDAYVRENVQGCETAAEFREMLRSKLQKKQDEAADRAFREAVEDALCAAVTCPLPEEMVSVSLSGFVSTLQRYAASKGETPEALLSRDGKDMQAFIEECRPHAEKQVRMSLALDYIIREEGYSVTEDAIEAYAKQCDSTRPLGEVIAALGGKDRISDLIAEGEAMKLVRSTAVPIDVPQ